MALWRIGRASMTLLFDKVSVSPPISSNAATLRRFYSANLDAHTQSLREKFMDRMSFLDINSQIGSCMPLAMMRIGTIINNIKTRSSQGGKLVRAARTCAKILKEPSASRFVSVRMPSGIEKLIDTRCKATIVTFCRADYVVLRIYDHGGLSFCRRDNNYYCTAQTTGAGKSVYICEEE